MSRRQIVITVGLMILGIGIVLAIVQATTLYISSQYPTDGAKNMPTVAPIRLIFNNAIDPASIKYTITPAVDLKVSVEKNTVLFTPTAGFITDTSYTFNLTSISTKTGVSTSKSITFTTKYLTASEVPDWVNATNLKQTDKNYSSNPITALLPYETLEYKIAYHLDTNQKTVLDITLYGQYNRPDQYDDYVQQLKDHKAAALDYLTQQGFNPADYTQLYTPTQAAGY